MWLTAKLYFTCIGDTWYLLTEPNMNAGNPFETSDTTCHPIYMPLLREEGAQQAVGPVLSEDEDIVSPFPAVPEEAIS